MGSTYYVDGWDESGDIAVNTKTNRQTADSVIFRFFHDYTLVEIATLLDIPLGTVKSRYYAGLQTLRKT
ncbi:hypothetical protein P615_18050 [Brevibacillus laterosporus PE36]|nr:sigma factor-like helix-turn-helix DNA-binding protein [Brevibacillus laterosporus]ERM18250.1 hypothetical protein P615_18050 [Brevibacillus laterosporus PE36]